MNKINDLILAMGVSLAAISLIMFGFSHAVILMIFYYLIISVVTRLIKNETIEKKIPIFVFNIYISIFNIIYIVLKISNIADIYSKGWTIQVQLIIPVIIGFLIRSYYINSKKVKKQ